MICLHYWSNKFTTLIMNIKCCCPPPTESTRIGKCSPETLYFSLPLDSKDFCRICCTIKLDANITTNSWFFLKRENVKIIVELLFAIQTKSKAKQSHSKPVSNPFQIEHLELVVWTKPWKKEPPSVPRVFQKIMSQLTIISTYIWYHTSMMKQPSYQKIK